MADPGTWAAIGSYIAEHWLAITIYVAPASHDHQQQRRAPRKAAA